MSRLSVRHVKAQEFYLMASEQAYCRLGPESILWLMVESFSKQDFSVVSDGGLGNHTVMEKRLMEQLKQDSWCWIPGHFLRTVSDCRPDLVRSQSSRA